MCEWRYLRTKAMRTLLSIWAICTSVCIMAQTQLKESIAVENQDKLKLNFDFADDINFEIWDNNQVVVEATVHINDGVDDEMFKIEKSVRANSIYFGMDKRNWEKYVDQKRKNCWNSEITINIKLPRQMEIDAETISANFTVDYYGQPMYFKTISGDIDLNVLETADLDFHVKTISGDIYSDLDVAFPDGKDGLRQVVGMNVNGRIGEGGSFSDLETISGNIYLRKRGG